MLDFEKVLDMLGGLTLLKFFPADVAARLELAKLVGRMAANEAQVEWLVQRLLAVCNEWPGPLVLRQIFCGKFKPQDGIEAGSTGMFPDGPPSERIESPALPMGLPPGHIVSSDKHIDDSVRELAVVKDLNNRLVNGKSDPLNPITQADVDKAVAALMEKRRGGRA